MTPVTSRDAIGRITCFVLVRACAVIRVQAGEGQGMENSDLHVQEVQNQV
jgi:hypothetical protein